MPFDDSDVKKMIEAQIAKGGLRFGSEGSAEVQDLISRMLQPEVTQRWPIELIQKHPWFGKQITPTENPASSISYISTAAINRAQDQGVGHAMQKRQGPPVYAWPITDTSMTKAYLRTMLSCRSPVKRVCFSRLAFSYLNR